MKPGTLPYPDVPALDARAKTPLRSWAVRVRGAQSKSYTDHYGDLQYYRPIMTVYVIARTVAGAVWQAKALAGYVSHPERAKRSNVLGCEALMELGA